MISPVPLLETSLLPSPRGIRSAAPSTHLPALDGFRGIAILLVLFYHLTFLKQSSSYVDQVAAALFDLAWIGVDLFFVLSGFLITNALFNGKGSPHYWLSFYARRTLRVFPLYYGFLFLYLVVAPALPGLKHAVEQHEQQVGGGAVSSLWYWLYGSNILFSLRGKFLGLSVTWSLAVEEQFYLVWPLVVLYCTPHRLIRVCVGLGICGVALRILAVSSGNGYPATYVLTPLHMDGLLVGSLIAAVLRTRPTPAILLPAARKIGAASFALAAVTVLIAELTADGGVRQNPLTQVAIYTLFALGSGCLLVTAALAAPSSRLAGALTHPVLRRFGKYSYSMYLFHNPVAWIVLRTLKLDQRPAPAGCHLPAQLAHYAICIAILYPISSLSWRYFEEPILRLKRFFPTSATAFRPERVAHPSQALPA